MEARAKSVSEILHSPDQFLIPFFQRNYSWKRKNWDRLWLDLIALGDLPNSTQQHFLGPLVCTPFKHSPGEIPSYQLIDGQQRLTTITILLAAIRDVAAEHCREEIVAEITEDCLIQKWKKGIQRYKVVPRTGDRDVLFAIIDRKAAHHASKSGIASAHRYFMGKISSWLGEQDPDQLHRLFSTLVGRMSLVVITINEENPYEIFESLNSTGLPLHESDLIRNYLFMQIPTLAQDDFNHEHWSQFERLFPSDEQPDYSQQTAFFRAYLMRGGSYSKAKSTFVDFKSQNQARAIDPPDQVVELIRFARYHRMINLLQSSGHHAVDEGLANLNALDATTMNPLLMHLLNRFESRTIELDDLVTCIRDLASFVIRRSICGESTRAYGRWFCEAIAAIDGVPSEDLRKYYLRRGWPDDAVFCQRLVDFPIYRREVKKCRMMLERLEESYGHKEVVNRSNLSIEHVMPQTIDKGKFGQAWQGTLGENWRTVHEKWCHTIGNLTLTGYNSDMSNRPYGAKRLELSRSNLMLNQYFDSHDEWNEISIQRRAREMAAEIARLWPRPEGQAYRPTTAVHDELLRLSERRKLRREYWATLLPLAQEHGFVPSGARRRAAGWINFPTGNANFHLLVYVKINDPYVAASILFKGPHRQENFDTLRANRSELEKAIGEKLLWQQQEGGQTLQATARLANADPLNRSDWPRQHEWLVCTLTNLMSEMQRDGESADAANSSTSDSKSKRHQFWVQLLGRAAAKTQLHSGISPGYDHWIAKSTGIRGVSYNYVISKSNSRVELVIYRGKGNSDESRRIFEEIRLCQSDVEQRFGSALEWEAAEGSQVFRLVSKVSEKGYGVAESEWPEIQENMIDGMTRLEKAVAPVLDQLKHQYRKR